VKLVSKLIEFYKMKWIQSEKFRKHKEMTLGKGGHEKMKISKSINSI